MSAVPLVTAILFSIGSTIAAEIREFDLKTIKRLGNELTRVRQRPDRGVTNAVRKQCGRDRKNRAARKAVRMIRMAADFSFMGWGKGEGVGMW